MHLLNTRTYEIREFDESKRPPYAILSHTWGDDEVTYADLPLERTRKSGRRKIVAFCSKALSSGFKWAWIDTCCINKASSTELSEAINSMYLWYEEAGMCFAYLSDLNPDDFIDRHCRWFNRGWTLQELIAPKEVRFYNRDWTFVGTKRGSVDHLSRITKIQKDVLAGLPPSECSVAQRMSWAAGRKTERVEDRAYSLFGLFGIKIPIAYGDRERAFELLQQEIVKNLDDMTIFVWDEALAPSPRPAFGLLARSPDAFENCQTVVGNFRVGPYIASEFRMTNRGLRVELCSFPYSMNVYVCLLQCYYQYDKNQQSLAIFLQRTESDGEYARVLVNGKSITTVGIADIWMRYGRVDREVFVPQSPHPLRNRNVGYGFWIRRLELPGYDRTNSPAPRIWSRDSRHRLSTRSAYNIVSIPSGECGTAGVIYLPIEHGHTEDWRVSWIKLGFDEEFNPKCILGNEQAMSMTGFSNGIDAEDEVTGSWQSLTNSSHEDLFSHAWLEFPESMTRKLSRQSHVFQGSYLNTQECAIDVSNINIRFERVKHPTEHHSHRKIWAVDIYSMGGSFVRHRRSNASWRRAVDGGFWTVAAVSTAGLIAESLSDRLPRREARRLRDD